MTTVIQWNPQHDTAVSQFREPGVDVPCLMPWRYMFIQEHSGKVVGCPYHTIPYGDLAQMSLQEIWNSEPIQEMRRSLLARQIPLFCLNHSAACPVIMEAIANGYTRPAEREITIGENDYWFLHSGWYGLERIPEPIRWTSGVAQFRISGLGSTALQIEFMTFRPGVAERPLTGSVMVDEQKLGTFALDSWAWQSWIFLIPKLNRVEDMRCRLIVDETWAPSSDAEFCDNRQLGVAVRKISTF